MPSYNFESQKKSARNLVLSPNSQLVNAELFADANLTRRQRFDGAAVFEQTPTRRTDKDMSGKGTEFATDSQLTNWDSKFTFKAELDDWLAGYALAFVMGKENVSAGSSSSSSLFAPFTHAIAFDESTTQAPMTNVYMEDVHEIGRAHV